MPLFTASPFAPVAYAAHGPSGRGESPLAKFLIGGAVTIVFEMGGGHFLEFMKIAKQTSTDSYLTIARRVTATKGLVGTLDGFFPWGFMQAVAKGSVFSFGQAASMNSLRPLDNLSKDQKMVISGGLGGLVQGVAMSPLLLLKTRVMTDPAFRSSGGLVQTAVASAKVGGRIVSTEGPSALFKGVTLFSMKRAADWTTRYLFVVMVEHAMRGDSKRKLSGTEEALASIAGGALSALSTIPMDVLVAAKQSAGAAGKKVSVMETFQAKIKEGGLAATVAYSTRGLAARVAHVAATTMAMKNITTLVYDIIYPVPVDAKKEAK